MKLNEERKLKTAKFFLSKIKEAENQDNKQQLDCYLSGFLCIGHSVMNYIKEKNPLFIVIKLALQKKWGPKKKKVVMCCTIFLD